MSAGIFSIPVQEAIIAITAATAGGELTMADNAHAHPGALGWLTKNDGSAQMRVQVVKRIGSTKAMVRKVANGLERDVPAPSYGYTDVSAFNATSTLCLEAQTVPVSHSHVPREIA